MTQFCTCHDSSAVMACAELCHDQSIIAHFKVTNIIQRLDYELIDLFFFINFVLKYFFENDLKRIMAALLCYTIKIIQGFKDFNPSFPCGCNKPNMGSSLQKACPKDCSQWSSIMSLSLLQCHHIDLDTQHTNGHYWQMVIIDTSILKDLLVVFISSQHPWMLEKDSLITVSGLEWESLYQLVNRGPGWTCMQWNLVTVSSLTITQHSYITILTMWSNSA